MVRLEEAEGPGMGAAHRHFNSSMVRLEVRLKGIEYGNWLNHFNSSMVRLEVVQNIIKLFIY